jgi:tRNA(fMet)-specific endonuclease VapC
MLEYLLDTSIVSAPIARHPDRRVTRKVEQQGQSCAIAAPVWHELVYGCARLPVGKGRSTLEDYLHEVVRRSFPILPYDEAAAEWHGSQRAGLEARGRPTPFVDGQIAAIACTRGLTLVTTNVRDFESFEGLTTVDWSR